MPALRTAFILATSFILVGTAPAALAEWVFCAHENEVCRFDGRAEVRYGADRRWASRDARNSIRCTNANFGDPAPGVVKSCFVWVNDQDSSAATPEGWRRCAREGEFCSFRGRATVHYGAAGRFESRSARNGIFCGNQTFGDPAPGRVKACYIATSDDNDDETPTGSGWRRCASEGDFCAFRGWREVRYGVGARWTTLTRNDGTLCSNEVFNDPAPGRVKACYVRARD